MNKKLSVFLIIVLFIQNFFYFKSGLALSKFPFLDGVPITSSTSIEAKYLMNWYFPIFFISVYFSGMLKSDLLSNGVPLLIRNFNKTKWIAVKFLNIVVVTFLFTVLQLSIFLIFTNDYPLQWNNFILLTTMYYLFLIFIISAQSLADLYIKPTLSLTIVNLLIIASILLSKTSTENSYGFNYIFIPSTIMGFRNGLTQSELSKDLIDPLSAIVLLLVLITSLIFLCTKRVNKMDII